MPLSRRRFLFGSAALATTVVGLAGCNASAGSAGEEATPSAAATGVEEGAYPVTIAHKYGSTTIDVRAAAGRHRRAEGAGRLRRPRRGAGRLDLVVRPGQGQQAVRAVGDRRLGRRGRAEGPHRRGRHPVRAGRRAEPRSDHRRLLGDEAGGLRQADQARPDRRAAEGVPGVGCPLGRPGRRRRSGARPASADDPADRGREEEGPDGQGVQPGVRRQDRHVGHTVGRRLRLRRAGPTWSAC